MVRLGTVVNGQIALEGPPLPDGMKVRVEPCDDGLFTNETYEEFIESLRQSIAETQAGDRGRPAEVVFAELREELRLRAKSCAG